MGTHGSIASEGASRVAVAWVWKRVIFDLIVPWLNQLKNGSVAVNRRQTRSNYTVNITADDKQVGQTDLATRLRFKLSGKKLLGSNVSPVPMCVGFAGSSYLLPRLLKSNNIPCELD